MDPQIPGGDLAFNEFVQEIDISHIDLCQLTEENNAVYLQFYINDKGEVEDLCILKGGFEVLNNELCHHFLTMPNWIVPLESGKKYCVYYVLPITFSLN